MQHNFFSHALLAIILFVVSILIFDGSGMYTVLLGTTAEVAGNLLIADDDFGATAERLEGIIPRLVAVIGSIILYYLAAAILIGLFNLIRRK